MLVFKLPIAFSPSFQVLLQRLHVGYAVALIISVLHYIHAEILLPQFKQILFAGS